MIGTSGGFPPSFDIEEITFGDLKLCPKCAEIVKRITGMTIEDINNGGLQKIAVKLKIAELTLTRVGVELDVSTIAETTLKHVEKILSKKLAEEEKERYEEKINLLKEKLIGESQQKEEIKRQLDEIRAKMKFVPALKGGGAELDLATRIRSVAPFDEPSLKQRHLGSTDIVYKVKPDENIVIGKIALESKDVEKWEDGFVQEARMHGQKEGTVHIMLATTAMPPDAINTSLDCFRSGVWVVPLELVEFAYAAYRRILIEQYKMQKSFDSQMETIKQEKNVVEKLRDIISTETFKKYSEIAKELFAQTDKLDDESRAMENYIHGKSESYKKVAETIRNLVNHMIEHSEEIQNKIRGTFSS